jgi:hypothetical protein
MVAVLCYCLTGAAGFHLAIAIQASRGAPGFCLGFDIRGSQAMLEHQVTNLVDRDLRFPGNKDVSLRLKLFKLCLDLL